MYRSPLLAVPAALIFAAAPLSAQMEHAHGGPPPTGGMGRVHLPSSCSPPAQALVERATSLLHSFWYEEAARTFGEAGAADSSCAMAWWGLSSSYLHPLWAAPTPEETRLGSAAAARARAAGAPTDRERGYVDAISAYWEGAGPGHGQRLRTWSDALERLHRAQPDDDEAATFYALSLVAVAATSPPDTTYARQRAAAAVLEPLFARYPDHPGLAHYLIHAYDAPALAAGATRAADRYARIAPAVPHARHMPSHIYIRLGQWDQAIRSNASSADAAIAYERQEHLPGMWDQRLHAMDYLAYAYLQQGRDAAARRVADTAATVTRWVPEQSIAAQYALAAIPARYAMERGRWREAADLPRRPGLAQPAEAVTLFARAIGAARGGDLAGAEAALAALTTIDTALSTRQVPLWSNMVRAQRLAAEAWVQLARGDTTAALATALQAADLEDRSEKHPVTPGAILPARELYGDMLLATGRASEAGAAFAASLERQPRRARSLAGAARAAERSGDRAAAQRYQRELRALLARADATRRSANER